MVKIGVTMRRWNMNYLKTVLQTALWLVFVTLSMASCASIGDVIDTGDFQYKIIQNGKSKSASIIKYTGVSTDVVIPAKLGKLNVVTIGAKSFQNKQLASVFIPAGVTEIGESAFANNQLTAITLPESIIKIGDHAFADNLLASVIIPAGVTYLSGFDSNHLTNITIPAGVESIGDFAFANNQLTSLVIPDNTGILRAAFVKNKLTSVTFEGILNASYANYIDSFDNALMLCYYGLDHDKHPGTYTRQNNGWLYNGELLRIAGFFAATTGVYVSKIDGEDPEKYKQGQVYIVPAGQHTVDVGYDTRDSRGYGTWTEGTVTFRYRYLFEGEVYAFYAEKKEPTETEKKQFLE
jgi:hypothetical protein